VSQFVYCTVHIKPEVGPYIALPDCILHIIDPCTVQLLSYLDAPLLLCSPSATDPVELKPDKRGLSPEDFFKLL
jgi:hypothetical protein